MAEGTAGEQHTLTDVAAAGDRVGRGDVLFAVDARPTALLTGAGPAFRDLHEGVADGADVAELEENLVALGVTDGRALTVDDHFDVGTTAAVETWQESLGLEPTGRVELGDVVFASAPATVADTHAVVGDQVSPGGQVLDLTGDTVLAAGSIPARLAGEVDEGSPARVELADGTAVTGTVRSIASEAVRPEEADVTDSTVALDVQLDLTDSPAARAGADASMAITTATRADVLAVPVAAIVDGGDGETAVRVPGGDGDAPVAVDTGLSAGGYVEIAEGAVAEGDTVLLPGREPET